MPADAALRIRIANQDDAQVLADLERNSPLVFDGRQLVIDRGQDYFAATRLMADPVVLLAEIGGEPAGVFCGAFHRAPIGGAERGLVYYHHARILPRFQDRGIGKRFSSALVAHYKDRGVDSPYWYINPANAHSQGFARNAANRWNVGPHHIVVPCDLLAGPSFGRRATPADAGRIVDILNTCHAGEEMFQPYSVESLTARLERAPSEYTWSDLWLSENAVAGVFREGDYIRYIETSADGGITESRGASLFDFGYLPGGAVELRQLLGAASAEILSAGMTALSLFSSPGARSWDVVSSLGGQDGQFDFWTPAIPEPPAVLRHGIYVDHIYF